MEARTLVVGSARPPMRMLYSIGVRRKAGCSVEPRTSHSASSDARATCGKTGARSDDAMNETRQRRRTLASPGKQNLGNTMLDQAQRRR